MYLEAPNTTSNRIFLQTLKEKNQNSFLLKLAKEKQRKTNTDCSFPPDTHVQFTVENETDTDKQMDISDHSDEEIEEQLEDPSYKTDTEAMIPALILEYVLFVIIVAAFLSRFQSRSSKIITMLCTPRNKMEFTTRRK